MHRAGSGLRAPGEGGALRGPVRGDRPAEVRPQKVFCPQMCSMTSWLSPSGSRTRRRRRRSSSSRSLSASAQSFGQNSQAHPVDFRVSHECSLACPCSTGEARMEKQISTHGFHGEFVSVAKATLRCGHAVLVCQIDHKT